MSRLALALLVVAVGCSAPAREDGAVSQTTVTAASVPTEVPISASIPVTTRPGTTPETLRVLVGGDLIPHRPSLAAPSALGSALAPLGPLFGQADGVIANYEAATGELEKKAFRMAYAASPGWLGALPATGMTAISVANNHACDLDYEGVEATLDAASAAGLTVLGGDPRSDPWAPRTVAERDGRRVCAVAWTTFVNAEGGCARTTRLAVAPESAAGRKKVAAALHRARAVCDATIAIVHGGKEYAPQTPGVLHVARQAAEAGADAVVVHHPHVPSPVLVHDAKDGRKVPIFASVGNLLSNQGESWKPPMFPVRRDDRRLVCVNGWTRLGVLADLSFSFAGGARLDWSFHLLWTDNDHAEDRSPVPRIATRLLDPEKDAPVVARLLDDAAGPLALFDDPCWTERPRAAEGEPDHSPRCATTLIRSRPPPRSKRRP